jgi:valyl-tRNA synthetase
MSSRELPKNFEFAQAEKKWYAYWEEKKYFSPAARPEAPNFCIVIPPPNVTGVLHIGHAFDNTIQDILIRYHRMMGENTLWQPGTDHAGRHQPQGARAREIHRAGLEMERGKRRDHHRSAQAAGRELRLEPDALHHGRGAFARGARGVRQAL